MYLDQRVITLFFILKRYLINMKSYVLVLVLVFVRSNRGKGEKGGQCLHKLEFRIFLNWKRVLSAIEENHHRFT